MLSYRCKCSEILFEVERKEEKFNRYETWHQLTRKRLRPNLQRSTIIWNVSNSLSPDWSLETLKSRFSHFKF